MPDIERDAWAFKALLYKGNALNFQSTEFQTRPEIDENQLFNPSVDRKAILAVLAACRVNVVAVASGMHEILVGLEKMPSRRDEAILPTQTRSGFSIHYLHARQPRLRLPKVAASLTSGAALYAGSLYPCGSSISSADRTATGTMSCLVTKNGRLYGLTNNHVTGKYSQTEPGMPILAPGLLDAQPGNLNPFTIGRHAHCAPWTTGTPASVPITGNLDLAIFEIADSNRVTSHQGQHYDTPVAVAKAADVTRSRNTSVTKVGRTTGLTSGFLIGRVIGNIKVAMNDPAFKSPVQFDNILMVRDATSSAFARPGDSGSLAIWTNNGQPEAVGIVFCIDFELGLTYLLLMEEVLASLHVGLVGNHNVQGSSHPGSGTL